MPMLTFGEVAAHLRRAQMDARFALDREVRLLMEGAAVEAKAMIGHELPEWPPLAPSTVAEKARLGFTGQVSDTDPLLRTGRLRDSIKAEAEAIGYLVEGVIGSDDSVAADQELGTSKIPPRPFLAPAMMSVEPRAATALGELTVRALTPGQKV